MKRAKESGVTVKIIVKPGQGHGWKEWPTTDMETCADWFDEHLRAMKK